MKSAHAVKDAAADILQPPAKPAPLRPLARATPGPATGHQEGEAVARAIKSLVDAIRRS